MDFEETYGETGKDYIHVHHITPLSDIGERYKLDPVKDLRPVCPNCHAMIHRQKPSLTIEALKALMKKAQNRNEWVLSVKPEQKWHRKFRKYL